MIAIFKCWIKTIDLLAHFKKFFFFYKCTKIRRRIFLRKATIFTKQKTWKWIELFSFPRIDFSLNSLWKKNIYINYHQLIIGYDCPKSDWHYWPHQWWYQHRSCYIRSIVFNQAQCSKWTEIVEHFWKKMMIFLLKWYFVRKRKIYHAVTINRR